MSSPIDLGAIMAAWAEKTPSVQGLVLIGSQQRTGFELFDRADEYSDWDFQIITTDIRMFLSSEWARSLPGMHLQAYAARVARIGAVPKVNVIFAETEMDLVIIPAHLARFMKIMVALGLHRNEGKIRQRLMEFALIIRPGWRILKGKSRWGRLYRKIVNEVPNPRLSDEAICRLADGFVCDYIWVVRKISRKELSAAQRTLHRELAEANFHLLHELKLRRGEKSFHEARRIERVGSAAEIESVAVNTLLAAEALRSASDKCAATLRNLMHDLVSDKWQWPDVK